MVGRYHIDPETAVMKIQQWPETDRIHFENSLVKGDPFAADGLRANCREITNTKVAKGFGRYLTFITRYHPEVLEYPVEQRITRDLVKGFVENLMAVGNGKVTILDRLQELHAMAVILSPEASFRFIKDIEARVRARVSETEKPQGRFVISDELLSLGFNLMDGANKQTSDRLKAIDFRDGFMISLLAVRPMRRKNFAGLRLGHNIVNRNGLWRIILHKDETKTHGHMDVEWPLDLIGPLEIYLDIHRPVLMAKRGRWHNQVGDAFWVSSHGSPLTQMAFYQQITKRTQEHLGKSVNPHQFRHSAASTLAVEMPAHVRVSASILGHASFQTTESYYIHAQHAQAHDQFVEEMMAIRAEARQSAKTVQPIKQARRRSLS
jgi:site-specific recombinase XerD